MNREIFYPSNLLSMSRFPLLAIDVYFLLTENYLAASIVLVIIWLTDLLDGFIARKRNEITELGKIIDPLADKIIIITLGLLMFAKGMLPLWFLIITLFRDVLILGGGLYLKNKFQMILPSNVTGKISVFIIGLTIMAVIINHSLKFQSLELIVQILLLLSVTACIISLINYSARFIKIIKTKKNYAGGKNVDNS